MHKKKSRKTARGFTLIDLMVTVVVVGILAAVAIPAYVDYMIRAQTSEGLNLAAGAKPLIADYYATRGEFPASMQESGYSGAVGKFVSETDIGENGAIIATLGGDANSKISGKTITLTPKVQPEGNLSWECTSTADPKYLPSSCANQAGNSNSDDWSAFWSTTSYDNGTLTTYFGPATYLGDDGSGNKLYSVSTGSATASGSLYFKVTPEHELLQCATADCTTGNLAVLLPNTDGTTGNMQGFGSTYVDQNEQEQNFVAYLPQTVNYMVASGVYPNTGDNHIASDAWNSISEAYHDYVAKPTAATADAYNAAAQSYVSSMKMLQQQGIALSGYDQKFIEMMGG